jgi:site-specific recombinase XerD
MRKDEKNKRVIMAFLEDGVAAATPSTRAALNSDLRILCLIAKEHDWSSLECLSRSELVTLPDILARRGYASASIARMLSSYRRFFAWLAETSQTQINLATYIPTVRIPRRKRQVLTSRESNRILRLASLNTTNAADALDYAVISLLYHTGIKVGELCALNLDDIITDGRASPAEQADQFPPVLRARSGRRQRFVLINDRLFEALQLWQHHRPHSDSPALFVSLTTGQRLTHRSINTIVRRLARRASIDKSVSPSTFRRSFASQARALGAPPKLIRTILGLSSRRSVT